MRRILNGRFPKVAVFVCLLVVALAFSAQSDWRSSRHIHVVLRAGFVIGPLGTIRLNPATVTVYGPNNYWQQVQFPGKTCFVSLPLLRCQQDLVFDNTPTGSYRIRVQWAGGKEDNQYGKLEIWENDDKYYFQSP